MKPNYLLQLLEVVGQTIGTVIMLIVMCVFGVIMVGLFLLMMICMAAAWLCGMPIKVTTPGLIAGTKVTEYYRWFSKVRR